MEMNISYGASKAPQDTPASTLETNALPIIYLPQLLPFPSLYQELLVA